jgi:L-fuconolactonase
VAVIDAHQHFWNLDEVEYSFLTPDLGVLYRNYTPADLEPELRANGVTGTVLVQATDSAEDTASMLRIAAAHDFVLGVVAWLPLNDPKAVREQIGTLPPVVKGIRHLIHTEPDPDWLVQPTVLESLRVLAEHGLAFDVVAVLPRHLEHMPTVVAAAPDLRVVIDHLAKPAIADEAWQPWADLLAAAAEHPTVFAKVSGLNTAAGEGWTAKRLQPYVDHALEVFGPERLMFGSDWPVLLVEGDYAQVLDATRECLSGLTTDEQEAVLAGTATRIYRL